MSTDDPTLSFITPRVAAGVLFTDDRGRVLMVVPSYKDYLDIPGGYVEKGETPYQAARREVYEELGIRPPIGRLLVADWWHDSPENNRQAKLLLVFDGGQLGQRDMQSIRVDGVEIRGTRLLSLANARELTIPRLANRLAHALDALRNRQTKYLENGEPIGQR